MAQIPYPTGPLSPLATKTRAQVSPASRVEGTIVSYCSRGLGARGGVTPHDSFSSDGPTQPFLTRTRSARVIPLLVNSHPFCRHHTRRPQPSPRCTIMSNTILTASSSSSSNLKAIFEASLKAYEERMEKSLLKDPLMDQLQACNSPTEILKVLRTHVQQFERSTSADDKLTKWLNPIVNVLYASSSVISAGVGMVNPVRMILLRVKL